jgi:hypothetical protein
VVRGSESRCLKMGVKTTCLKGRRKSEEPGGALEVEECLVGLGLGGGFKVRGGRGGAVVEGVGMMKRGANWVERGCGSGEEGAGM